MLFRNLKGKRFRLATRDAGPYFDAKHVGRGAAFGDIDNDGDIDIVVNHKDAAPALLRNDTKSDNHWIRLELRGTRSNRDAIGARVEVEAGGRTIVRQRKGGYSLESSNDPRLLIGVGPAGEVDKVTLRWPSGAVSTLEHLKTDRSYTVVEPTQGTAAGVRRPIDDRPMRRGGRGPWPIRTSHSTRSRPWRWVAAAVIVALARWRRGGPGAEAERTRSGFGRRPKPTSGPGGTSAPRPRWRGSATPPRATTSSGRQAAKALGRPDEALAELARIPDGDPAAPRARLLAGQIELRRDRVRRAEAALLAALELDPTLVPGAPAA